MPTRHSLLRAAVVAAVALPPAGDRALAQPAAALAVRAENPLEQERRDETLALAWSEVRQRLSAAAPGRVRVREAASGRTVVSQLLDADGDGQADSLLFQASFFPREVKGFVVEAAAPDSAPAPRVHVKFVPERTDVAWESDRIAYRTYGQLLWQLENLHSSGYDVWVKRTRALVLDRWYAAGHDAYHADRGEGADFYSVGASLGAGGTAIWRDGRLYRAENFASHRVLANGPIRALFELTYDPWDAAGVRVTERKRISLDAGANLFRQESVYEAEGVPELTYAVGTVKRPGLVGSTSRAQPWAWLSTWGPVTNKPGEGGHGELGTGALVEREHVVDVKETSDHYVLLATARVGEPVVQWVGAGWTGSRDFASVTDWWAHLDARARALAAPIRVTLGEPGAAAAAR